MNVKSFFFTNQSSSQTVAKNTIWLFVGEVGGRLARFALVVYTARVLGANDWGLFTYALSIASVFSFVSDWGFNALITRFLSQEPDNDSSAAISTIIYSKVALSLLALFVTVLIGTTLSTLPAANYLISITATLTLFDGLRDFALSINRATEKMEREAVVKITTNLAIFLIGVIGLVIVPHIKTMAMAYAIGSGIGLLIATYFIKETVAHYTGEYSWAFVKRIFFLAWPFALLSATMVILSNMDMLALGKWSTAENVGIYASAQRTAQLFHIIPSIFSFALFPQLSRFIHTNKEKFKDIAQYSTALIFLIVMPLIFIGIITAKPVLSFLFGESYEQGASSLSLLMVSLPFVFLHILFTNILIAQNKQKSTVVASIVGVAIGLLLTILLVPSYSIIGATVSIVAAQAAIATVLWIIARKDISFIGIMTQIQKIAVASIVAAGVALAVQQSVDLFFVTILVSGAAYLLTLYHLKDRVFLRFLSVLK